ncbi:Glu/Leu/Phe/Val dehydrogenase [Neorhizobium sp. P12A]|uniref:Glu/Leu/Phe/Val dehydrogenase family protein n=1 Tax=Neorhizobium sp. P12A TaxID=2268027 RepID=UPI00165E13E1|nr:Glu/Leu/Phe/Val dehydrogenase [Neorhizobium sp. P12A]
MMDAQVPSDWRDQRIAYVEHGRFGRIGAIVIDSLTLGPALGGCRMWRYERFDDALLDARRLSRGMSYKNAMAGLPLGGGKSVLLRPEQEADRAGYFDAFAEAVDALGGRYLAAEDVGTAVTDMQRVRRKTPYVFGVPSAEGLAGGDPSPWTARGVFSSISAVAARIGKPLGTLSVAVQGLGHVGMSLCQLLFDEGVELMVADINPAALTHAERHFRAKAMPAVSIHAADVDIFAPCALGAVLNENTIPQIRARAVVGAANNQLATDRDGSLLMERGILYAPDYIVNAGGVINVAGEYLNETPAMVGRKVEEIGERLLHVLDRAEEMRIPANVAADLMAREILLSRAQSAQIAAG